MKNYLIFFSLDASKQARLNLASSTRTLVYSSSSLETVEAIPEIALVILNIVAKKVRYLCLVILHFTNPLFTE